MLLLESIKERTIPTHVGRTVSLAVTTSDNPDHPHARGENDLAIR